MSNSHVQDFYAIFNQPSLIREPIYLKNLERPTKSVFTQI